MNKYGGWKIFAFMGLFVLTVCAKGEPSFHKPSLMSLRDKRSAIEPHGICSYTLTILDECNSDSTVGGQPRSIGDVTLAGIRGNKGVIGDKGDKGDIGDKGEIGDRGNKGEKGEPANSIDSSLHMLESESGKHQIELGTDANPALSCSSFNTLDYEQKSLFNPAKPEQKIFRVMCKETLGSETCLINPKTGTEEYKLSGTDFWLSKDEKFSIAELYGLQPSELNYLMKLSDEVSINVTVHYKIKIDLEKSLKILLWDHQIIGATFTPESPIHYEIQNDCKDSTGTTEWCKAAITLKTLPTLFRDFLFQNISPEEDQRVKIEITKVCFTDEMIE